MPIQLDKILTDIAGEKALHPNYPGATKKEVDDAWARVGRNNKLSVHEARSIFKVLQKKYEQEKAKSTPSWKLFGLMDEIHQKVKLKEEIKEEDDGMLSMEEDEEYEMLEVQEEDESVAAAPQQTQQGKTAAAAATSDGESPAKSSTTSNDATPERDDKPLLKTLAKAAAAPLHNAQQNHSNKPLPVEEKKLLNTLAPSASSRAALSTTPSATAATAAALHKKGITMKKTTTTAGATASSATSIAAAQHNTAAGSSTAQTTQAACTSVNAQSKNSSLRIAGLMLEVGETIPLPESIKRKLVENQAATPPAKKLHNTVQPPSGGAQLTTAGKMQAGSGVGNTQTLQLKQEPEEVNNMSSSAGAATTAAGINLITITGNTLTNGGGGGGACSSTAATVASTSTNGYSPRLEEIDFRNDIIFDAGNGGAMNGNATGETHTGNVHSTNAAGIINLGNFDNSLPPTFFKNLCNSSRHEALGLYVANVMNRLRPRSAAKLELGILRAIIDVQTDELEQ